MCVWLYAVSSSSTGCLYTGICHIGGLLSMLPVDHMVQPTLAGYHSNSLLAIPGEYTSPVNEFNIKFFACPIKQ